MPKRISRTSDVNQAAFQMVQRSTAEPEPKPKRRPRVPLVVSQVMSAMGRRGGKIGGKRRLETMTAEERSQIALKAARTRWAKKKSSAAK